MMLKSLAALAIVMCTIGVAQAKPAKPAFTGSDFSGVYDCIGIDDHEGEYKGTVTLQLVRAQSFGTYGAYNFKLEVPGYGVYPGHAAAHGREMAIHFALTDPEMKDYGTGIASFVKGKGGKWTFHKYYYEPEFKGGNFGVEDCKHR
jgi:hypothetical protein